MAHLYTRAVARVVVAQIAESLGFDGVQHSACEALSELLIRYISEIGYLTHTSAEYAGRPDCNINDLLLAFQDMGIDMEEVIAYADALEEHSFVHTMPKLPALSKPPAVQTFKASGLEPPKHIPDHLPAFPEKHTYVETSVFTGHTKDVKEQKQAQLKAKKNAEKAIVKLSEREHAVNAQPEGRPYKSLFLAPPELEQPADHTDMQAGADDAGAGQTKQPFSPTGAWKESEVSVKAKKKPKILENPLQLDWRLPVIPHVPANLGFEDAFAEMRAEPADKGNRKRRQSLKSTDAGEPQIQRAQQILAAGPDAVFLDDGQPEKSGR